MPRTKESGINRSLTELQETGRTRIEGFTLAVGLLWAHTLGIDPTNLQIRRGYLCVIERPEGEGRCLVHPLGASRSVTKP